ncbi:beta-1,3-galactosyltransferase 6 isoform X1 [Athalia rosae]|uniref:beta-1,3-galactosyltransferase 6 isoform X1 n=1 Tax=Athalia rosae TaxID=37344 RepID=UPI0020344886|nr:beta-1,3-galactosyltransferase 6 isoform X1 [Athalia rosae]
MLIRHFKGTTKCLAGLLLLALIYAFYAETSRVQEQRKSALVDSSINKRGSFKLLIIILSRTSDVARREAIRNTWLSKNHNGVKHLFIIGTSGASAELRKHLTSETKTHQDLLLLSELQDSYDTLTEKVLQSFSRVYRDYKFEYLLKCDDDSLVLVDKLLTELEKWENRGTGKELYWGFFNGKAQVKQSGPWKETDWIFCDYYLPYALGGGYVLSRRLVQFIAENSKILKSYKSEDISVGLWLAPLSNIERKHDVRFDTEYRSRGCSNEYIITHKQGIQSMNTIYQMYKASGALCMKEVRHRNSYQYDWSVPPSKCCNRQPGIP